jgi:hypothetical protein
MRPGDSPELTTFVRGERDLHDFPHREHLRMAFEMLRRHDFAASVHLYSAALRAMTARAGKPEAFNQTVTIAFLALLAERMHESRTSDFEQLVQQAPALLNKGSLTLWYSEARLTSRAARQYFLLPDRLP